MTKQNRLKRRIIIISLIILLVAAAFAAGIWVALKIGNNNNQTPGQTPDTSANPPNIDENAVKYDFEIEDKGGAGAGIKIPGYPLVAMKKDTDVIEIALTNPEGNPCYFQFDLVMDEGSEVLYSSELVPPGMTILEEKLSREIPEGKYALTIRIATFSLADYAPMNGANVNTTLYVN